MTEQYYKWEEDFNKIRASLKLEIKKFNKENQLCYYDSIDLTGRGLSEENIELFAKLFTNTEFKIDLKKSEYTGIYDPSRGVELINLYPTDEELLRKELRYKNL